MCARDGVVLRMLVTWTHMTRHTSSDSETTVAVTSDEVSAHCDRVEHVRDDDDLHMAVTKLTEQRRRTTPERIARSASTAGSTRTSTFSRPS